MSKNHNDELKELMEPEPEESPEEMVSGLGTVLYVLIFAVLGIITLVLLFNLFE